MKKFILLIIFLIPLKLFAPNLSIKEHSIRIKYIKENILITNNLIKLKDNQIKSRKEVFDLAQETIEIYLNRGDYKKHFPNLDSLSYGLACIFVSESSNSLGQSARSSLWLKSNNPFGLTASKGRKLISWELIKGNKVVCYRNFQTFTSFKDAIDGLINSSLIKKNYDKTRNSSSIKEFLYNLQRDGYCTNKHWPEFAYNQIYLKFK
ncbi:MAG: hypothetical protein M0R17_04905 [Candidatus Omnitrophica bacterium]|jgi:hypothetical protein|nr:hypothetical protein [Candidatus Omnitrophota bacterium]